MATILEFPASHTRASSTHTMSGHLAQVVIFPGVRYERVEIPEAKPRKRPSTRRDHLELED
jgi:hypothetical protein